MKKLLWSSVKSTAKDAQLLSDFYNEGLSPYDKTEVIILSPPSWFGIIGNDIAEKWAKIATQKVLEAIK